MPGRHTIQTSADTDENGNPVYRYGFQGQETDFEVKGSGGNSVNYKYRMHDPRLGRFFAVAPLASEYPQWTPYQFSGNIVIAFVELEGLEPDESATGVKVEELTQGNGEKIINTTTTSEVTTTATYMVKSQIIEFETKPAPPEGTPRAKSITDDMEILTKGTINGLRKGAGNRLNGGVPFMKGTFKFRRSVKVTVGKDAILYFNTAGNKNRFKVKYKGKKVDDTDYMKWG